MLLAWCNASNMINTLRLRHDLLKQTQSL